MCGVKDEKVTVEVYEGINGYAISGDCDPALVLSKDYLSVHFFIKGTETNYFHDTVCVCQKTPENTLVVTFVFDVEDYSGNRFIDISDFSNRCSDGYKGKVYKNLMSVEIRDMEVDSEYSTCRQGYERFSTFFYRNVYGVAREMIRRLMSTADGLEDVVKASEFRYSENCRVLSAQAYADRFEVDEYADNPMSCFYKIESVTFDESIGNLQVTSIPYPAVNDNEVCFLKSGDMFRFEFMDYLDSIGVVKDEYKSCGRWHYLEHCEANGEHGVCFNFFDVFSTHSEGRLCMGTVVGVIDCITEGDNTILGEIGWFRNGDLSPVEYENIDAIIEYYNTHYKGKIIKYHNVDDSGLVEFKLK